MTQEHPITPPPELVRQWAEQMTTPNVGSTTLNFDGLVAQAARWGADQELEACINYFHEYDPSWGKNSELITGLRAARRPKPPSLKEQALAALRVFGPSGDLTPDEIDALRRALESLPN